MWKVTGRSAKSRRKQRKEDNKITKNERETRRTTGQEKGPKCDLRQRPQTDKRQNGQATSRRNSQQNQTNQDWRRISTTVEGQ